MVRATKNSITAAVMGFFKYDILPHINAPKIVVGDNTSCFTAKPFIKFMQQID